MKSRLLDTLRERVLIYDGAMGTQIQARSLGPDDFGGKEGCNDYLVVSKPSVVEQLHAAYRAALDSEEATAFVLASAAAA